MNKSFYYKSYGKLNLHLKVLNKESNMHFLEMLNTEISLFDEINGELTYPGKGNISIDLNSNLNIDIQDNLIYKAVKAYLNESKLSFDISFNVKKNILTGSGLGGGSSNAAYTLLYLNSVFNCFNKAKLTNIGFSIGSDIPFFIKGGLNKVTGFGETLEPIEYPIEKYSFVLLIPDFALSTKLVYDTYDQLVESSEIKKELETSINLFPLRNDLFISAKKINPLMEDVIYDLKATNPLDASMTGSGSGCFAIYKSMNDSEEAYIKLKNKFKNVYIVTPKLNRNS
jgi:4-diphosphocytidyl-2-C-methyl-D-erythritol kinase